MLLSVAGVEECVKNTLKSFHVLKSPSVDFSNRALFNKICHRNPIFCGLQCRVHSELTVLVFLCFSLKKFQTQGVRAHFVPTFLFTAEKSSLSLVNSSPSCYIFSNFVWKGGFTTHGTFIHLFPSFSETTIKLPLDFLCEVACSNESPASNCTHIRRITSHLLLRNVTQSRRSMSNQQSSAVWHSRQMQVQKRHTLKNLNLCVGLWVF